jgi:hypothetical protein
MRASGSVDLKDTKHPFVRLVAAGNNLRVFDSPRGLVDANIDVTALGPLDELRVTGGGEMLGGYLALKQFRKDLLRVKAPGDLSTFAIFDTSAKPNDKLRVALELAKQSASPSSPTCRSSSIAATTIAIDRRQHEFYTGDGEVVRVHMDQRSSDQWAVGFVRIGDGAAFFRTRLCARPWLAHLWTAHERAGPRAAGGRTNRVGAGPRSVSAAVPHGGTSTGPSVGLESGTLFPIRGRELNGYLTLGRLTTSLIQQSGTSLAGMEAWSGQLNGETGALAHRQQGATALGVVFHDLGTGATKEYGLDAFSVSPADVPTELVFGKTGGVRGALIEGGRYITTDLFVAGQLRFTTGIPGIRMAQKFGTYYRSTSVSSRGSCFQAPEQLGITHPTIRTGVFGAFLTRMWDF